MGPEAEGAPVPPGPVFEGTCPEASSTSNIDQIEDRNEGWDGSPDCTLGFCHVLVAMLQVRIYSLHEDTVLVVINRIKVMDLMLVIRHPVLQE